MANGAQYFSEALQRQTDRTKKGRRQKAGGAGELLEQLTVKRLFKPGMEDYWRRMQKNGMSSQDIVDTIYADDVSIKRNIVAKEPIEAKPSAAQEKFTQQTQSGQNLLDALSGQLGQQAEGVNQGIEQMTGALPFGDFVPPQQITPQQMLPQQQQGIMGLLQANPQAATFDTMQESFPRFGAPADPLSPLEQMTQEKLGILRGVEETGRREIAAFPSLKPHKPPGPFEKRRLDIAERRVAGHEETRRIQIIAEKRRSLDGDRRYEVALIRAGVTLDRLDLDKDKYLIELAKLDETSDFKILNTLLDHAKTMSPGATMTPDLLGQAADQLKVMNPRFNKIHERAIKRVRHWFYWTKPTLKGVEEVTEPVPQSAEDVMNNLRKKW